MHLLHLLLELNGTSPYDGVNDTDVGCKRERPHHGNLTDQFRNIAANPRSVRSVITALPSLKNKPPTAGNNAKASGVECQLDGSMLINESVFSARGRSKSSVEDLIDCLVDSTESEKVELRRFFKGCSANVVERPKGRCRRGDRLGRTVSIAALATRVVSGGGLLVWSRS